MEDLMRQCGEWLALLFLGGVMIWGLQLLNQLW